MTDFNRKAFHELEKTVHECASYAKRMQDGITRRYKSDGSVLTDTDMRISSVIEEAVSRLFPEAAFVCEETEGRIRKDAPYTFVLDPVDGTDVYSQGLPCFAVALGVLDENRHPCGAVIAAPRFGIGTEELFISLCPAEGLKVNGKDFVPHEGRDTVTQITCGSTDLARIDFSRYEGKVRVFGSSIIHLLSPVIFSSIQGCINPPSYAWDVAASHAVLLSQGMVIEYCDGSAFEYTDEFLYEKRKMKCDIYAGTEEAVRMMRQVLPLKA